MSGCRAVVLQTRTALVIKPRPRRQLRRWSRRRALFDGLSGFRKPAPALRLALHTSPQAGWLQHQCCSTRPKRVGGVSARPFQFVESSLRCYRRTRLSHLDRCGLHQVERQIQRTLRCKWRSRWRCNFWQLTACIEYRAPHRSSGRSLQRRTRGRPRKQRQT